MQLRHLERLIRKVYADDIRAACSHGLCQYAAPAAGIEHALVFEPHEPIDMIEPQRVDLVQRLEFGIGIPPPVGQLAEFFEFAGIDVDHGPYFFLALNNLPLSRASPKLCQA